MNPISTYGSQNIGAARQGKGPEKPIDIATSGVSPVKANPNPASPVQSSVADMASQGAPVDESRVAALRESIANGSYTIDSGKIAAKMIELDLGIAAN